MITTINVTVNRLTVVPPKDCMWPVAGVLEDDSLPDADASWYSMGGSKCHIPDFL